MSAPGRPVRMMGLGTCVPDRIVTNEELSRTVDTTDEWIVTRTGIRERRMAPPEARNSTLASEAALRALADARVAARDLELIVLGTASPDMPFPSTACFVSQRIGSTGAAAFDLSSACSGFVYSLSVVTQYIRSGEIRCGMAIGSEILTKIMDPADRATCVLFGDGSGAAVLGLEGDGPEILDTRIRAGDTDQWEALHLPAGGTAMPASEATVRGRQHFIKLKGQDVYKLAVKRMIEILGETLDRNGLKPEDIDLLVPHQMNRRIMETCADRFGFPMEKVMVNIERMGNTSSASIPLALDDARRAGRMKKGDTVILVTFGGGFTWGTAVLRW